MKADAVAQRVARVVAILAQVGLPRKAAINLVKSESDRPILVLTTESSDEKKARARAAGATGWIVKPFDPEKLAAAVRRVSH